MSDTSPDFHGLRVCVIGPFLPRPGGVSVQSELLCRFLEQEGAVVRRVSTDVRSVRRLPIWKLAVVAGAPGVPRPGDWRAP